VIGNPLTRDPLHETVEQNCCVRKTAEHQRLIEASIRAYSNTRHGTAPLSGTQPYRTIEKFESDYSGLS